MDAKHWHNFVEFSRYELMAGGPDPQLATVFTMSWNVSPEELIWRAGCYVSVYNVPGAEVLWQYWPFKVALEEGTIHADWLNEHWEGIPTRVERRCIRRPEWLSKFFNDYLAWAISDKSHLKTYDDWFESCQQVKFMGRYVALKLLEFLHRYANIDVPPVPDIRAKGGWSPVKTISILMEREIQDVGSAEGFAAYLRAKLSEELDQEVSFFQLQVLLCEYRESYFGKRQYPGRSHDSELSYLTKVQEYWRGSDYKSQMFKARANRFPLCVLGEEMGWSGVRKELGRVISEHNYTWSDFEYSYTNTTDLANPAPQIA